MKMRRDSRKEHMEREAEDRTDMTRGDVAVYVKTTHEATSLTSQPPETYPKSYES